MVSYPPDLPIVQKERVNTQGLSALGCAWVWWKTRRRERFVDDWTMLLPGSCAQLLQLEPHKPHFVDVPRGFSFDGASIPRPLWFVFSPTNLLYLPAVIHDYAYRHHQLIIDYQEREVSKREADALFYELGVALNRLAVLHWVAWLCVAVFGFKAWRKKKGE